MWIECTIRRQNGTSVLLGKTTYKFEPYSKTDPRHLCEVDDPDDIQTFLAIKEAYRIAKPQPVPAADAAALSEAEDEINEAEKAAKPASPTNPVPPKVVPKVAPKPVVPAKETVGKANIAAALGKK